MGELEWVSLEPGPCFMSGSGKLLAFLLPLFLLFSKRKTVSTTPAAMRRGPPVEDKGMKESWVRILDAGSQK
ncbi:hypothetical protein [Bifidobacterium breve]|uniref:hypothetical protein n=1 Tax=Bifidobacterium breve TaxID=1685 RepID=UPI00254D6D6D|nr:hypothetical protein [Bifidobacterium breve]MDK7091204.1 hypothetical protein [Bifidobacterium breve]